MSSPVSSAGTATEPGLRRVLSLWDLILYGIIIISPVGVMTNFGVLSRRGNGHVATTILIAVVPMLLTAVSYGRMARAYPSAGSAFTYVGREISPVLGYVVGWSMVLDYLLGPLICIIWCSQQAHVFVPAIPYCAWAVLLAILFTGWNIQGVQASARLNTVLVAVMAVVILVFLGAAALYVATHPHVDPLYYTRPFYDPQAWTWKGILGGTSLAALTYMGFDGISTLSEEVVNPRRNILLAMIVTCVVIGVVSVLQAYMAQLVWTTSEGYPDLDTAFTFIAQRVWQPLFAVVGLTLVVANLGSGLGGQLGVARLLYGMGRSGALPRSFFGVISPKRHVPRNNVLLVGVLALAGALVFPMISGQETGYELGANLLNFGALIAFMGVNAAAFVRFCLRQERKRIADCVLPAIGFFVCLLLWWNLSMEAKVIGASWMAIGTAYGAWRTRGFRGKLLDFGFPPEADAGESIRQEPEHLAGTAAGRI
jgi:putrescine importer